MSITEYWTLKCPSGHTETFDSLEDAAKYADAAVRHFDLVLTAECRPEFRFTAWLTVQDKIFAAVKSEFRTGEVEIVLKAEEGHRYEMKIVPVDKKKDEPDSQN